MRRQRLNAFIREFAPDNPGIHVVFPLASTYICSATPVLDPHLCGQRHAYVGLLADNVVSGATTRAGECRAHRRLQRNADLLARHAAPGACRPGDRAHRQRGAWWNDAFFPLLFLQSERPRTIPLGMRIFFGQHATNGSAVFSGMQLASLPLLVIYLLMSRQFIAGLTSGAIKS
ncbi:MAG TPA: hypothetical protein VF171_01025 [Trueperaceae bacterium]